MQIYSFLLLRRLEEVGEDFPLDRLVQIDEETEPAGDQGNGGQVGDTEPMPSLPRTPEQVAEQTAKDHLVRANEGGRRVRRPVLPREGKDAAQHRGGVFSLPG